MTSITGIRDNIKKFKQDLEKVEAVSIDHHIHIVIWDECAGQTWAQAVAHYEKESGLELPVAAPDVHPRRAGADRIQVITVKITDHARL